MNTPDISPLWYSDSVQEWGSTAPCLNCGEPSRYVVCLPCDFTKDDEYMRGHHAFFYAVERLIAPWVRGEQS